MQGFVVLTASGSVGLLTNQITTTSRVHSNSSGIEKQSRQFCPIFTGSRATESFYSFVTRMSFYLNQIEAGLPTNKSSCTLTFMRIPNKARVKPSQVIASCNQVVSQVKTRSLSRTRLIIDKTALMTSRFQCSKQVSVTATFELHRNVRVSLLAEAYRSM